MQMTTAVLPLLIGALLLAFLLQRLYTFFNSQKEDTTTYDFHHLVREIDNVLNPPGKPLDHLLKERADSNQRLVRALGISNTFVSADTYVHKRFVLQARTLLNNVKRKGWKSFQSTALDAVQWQLCQNRVDPHNPNSKDGIPFDVFVRNITLVVVLQSIIQVDIPLEYISYDDITLVAGHISTLWALSKKSDPIPPILLHELNTALRRLVVDEEQFPNPLDLVVPTWETLWRVVATSVAYSYGNKEFQDAFREFNESPSEVYFEGGCRCTHEVTVRGILYEAMRLHPPSKHISRCGVSGDTATERQWWYPSFLRRVRSYSMTSRRSANIERILRSNIWGPTVGEFDPHRHQSDMLTEDQGHTLRYVFGHGPLKCIAASWAPLAAAVISGAILHHLDKKSGYVMQVGAEIGGRSGWNDWVIRKVDE